MYLPLVRLCVFWILGASIQTILNILYARFCYMLSGVIIFWLVPGAVFCFVVFGAIPRWICKLSVWRMFDFVHGACRYESFWKYVIFCFVWGPSVVTVALASSTSVVVMTSRGACVFNTPLLTADHSRQKSMFKAPFSFNPRKGFSPAEVPGRKVRL